MKQICTEQAPKAIGPYSQGVAIQTGKLLFLSGQIPLDPKTDQVVEGGIVEQTTQVLNNLEQVLAAASADFSHVVKVDVFMTHLARDFQAMNSIYAKRFNVTVPPARATIGVAALPKDVLIEIACIAQIAN